MQGIQNNYLAAYRSLKLTRDSEGVLVAEFHSNNGPFTFTAQDHTEFVSPPSGNPCGVMALFGTGK